MSCLGCYIFRSSDVSLSYCYMVVSLHLYTSIECNILFIIIFVYKNLAIPLENEIYLNIILYQLFPFKYIPISVTRILITSLEFSFNPKKVVNIYHDTFWKNSKNALSPFNPFPNRNSEVSLFSA